MIKYFLVLLVFFSNKLEAQKTSPVDQQTIDSLKTTITYLADDRLEGRRTGTQGEKLAYEFITNKFAKSGLKPMGDNGSFIQSFEVNEGKDLGGDNNLTIGNTRLSLKKDFFPMPYSATGKFIFSDDKNPCKPYMLELSGLINANKDNPHFDLVEAVQNRIKEEQSKGINIILLSNSTADSSDEKFDEKDRTALLTIPVIYLTSAGLKKYDRLLPQKHPELSCSVQTVPKTRQGHNVVGYINNSSPATIIIGAHYDHLGYGEDHNSLYIGSTPMIHNGADDNASGTAALIFFSNWLRASSLTKYNYLIVAFSGEELGLYGSKYLADHCPVDIKSVNYMINMDMIGRLNDSTHGLTIGGYGTSPAWGRLIKTSDPYFKINIDSAGSGPSDHTSFYRKEIPVLFFFTGSHKDYHKPSDDADKINYAGELKVIQYIKDILTATNTEEKLSFTKTRESAMGRSSFKVSLGIMPDYTYTGAGVLVDGVSDGRPAQKAGIKTGDVLLQLGDHSFSDVMSYMGALNKFNKGDSTTVKLRRGADEMTLKITF